MERRMRVGAAVVLAGAMAASFSVVGSSAFGKNNKPSAAQYQYKVTICHRTRSQTKPTVTIQVSSRALKAHLRHGDTLGACASAQASSSSTEADGNGRGRGNGKGNGRGRGNGK